MLKKFNLVGVIIGVLVIAVAVFVLALNLEVSTPDTTNIQSITKITISAPESESNKYYGGDAYTGIQQAAAQTARNLIPVFEAIEENSEILIKENENLKILNNNINSLSRNNADNDQLLISVIQNGIGVILLAIGLAIIARNLEVEIQFRQKGN